jgi:hypothetical protein
VEKSFALLEVVILFASLFPLFAFIHPLASGCAEGRPIIWYSLGFGQLEYQQALELELKTIGRRSEQ